MAAPYSFGTTPGIAVIDHLRVNGFSAGVPGLHNRPEPGNNLETHSKTRNFWYFSVKLPLLNAFWIVTLCANLSFRGIVRGFFSLITSVRCNGNSLRVSQLLSFLPWRPLLYWSLRLPFRNY